MLQNQKLSLIRNTKAKDSLVDVKFKCQPWSSVYFTGDCQCMKPKWHEASEQTEAPSYPAIDLAPNITSMSWVTHQRHHWVLWVTTRTSRTVVIVWAFRIQSRVDISSEKTVAEVRQKRSTQDWCQSFETKTQNGEGKSLNITEDQIKGQLSHNKLFLRLSSFHGIHYSDIFCIVNGNCSCQPISRCICIPFSFLLWWGSDNKPPALWKYLVFDQINKMRNPGTTPPMPFIFILVSL